MEQPANSSLLGKSPPSPGGAPPDLTEAKKALGSRRRTTSNTRHRYTANQQLQMQKNASHVKEIL